MPSLVFTGERFDDFRAPLDEALIVGSGDGSNLLVEHGGLSPCHAEFFIEPEDGRWCVRDLGSAAGTFVNGTRVKSGRIHDGDEISFGSITARFVHGMEASHARVGDSKQAQTKRNEPDQELSKEEQAKPGQAREEQENGEKAKRDKLAAEVAELQKGVRDLKAEKDALQDSIHRLTKEKSDGASALEERAARLAEAAGALERVEGERAKLAGEVEYLSGIQGTLTARRASLEETIAIQNAEQGRLGALLEEFAGRHAAVDAAFQQAGQKRAQLLAEIAGLEGSKGALDIALQERSSSLEDHDRALRIAAEDGRKLAKQHATLSAEAEALKTAIGVCKVEQETRQATIVALALERANVESALYDAQSALQDAESALQERTARLTSQQDELGRAQEALQQLESQRSEAQKDLDRLQEEQQEMSRSARRLEAAVEGRRVEEERLRETLQAQEARMAEMASGAKVQEAELRERESALERAARALTEAKEQHALLLDEVGKFESQILSLTAEGAGLREQRARLRDENTQAEALIAGQQEHNRELEKKRAEALRAFTDQKAQLDAVSAAHVDLQDQHRKLRGDLELATATHKTLLTESAKHTAGAKAAQDEEARCRTESARLTALAASVRKESESLSRKNAELTAMLGDLDSRVTATRERLAALSGTEERLVQARAELEQIRQQHATLTDEVARLSAERDATREQHVTLGDEIVHMDRERSRLEGEMVDVKARHQEMVRSFEQYHSESTDARRLLGADLAKVEAQISNAQSRQESVLSKVAEAQSRHAELVVENRRMETAVRDLAEVEEDIRVSEMIAKEIEERRQTLESECAEAQERLAKSAESVDASRADLKQLEEARTQVKEEIAALTEGEKKQRARFGELQSLNRDAEQLAADQRTQHEEALHRMSEEVMMHEARLTRARGWHEELDKLYGELALLPEKSPEGGRYLEKIHERKREIASQVLNKRAAKK